MSSLLQWRRRMGWTQQQAADALGMYRPNYSRLEKGGVTPKGMRIEPDLRTRLACAAIERMVPPIS